MPLTGEAKREYQREWMRKRRQDWIDSQGGVCANCGSDELLEVDHIDPDTKTMQPTAIWSRSSSVREAELAKCQVLCESCHMAKTVQGMVTEPAAHGTISRYANKKYKCRCDMCKAASAEYQRKRRSKN